MAVSGPDLAGSDASLPERLRDNRKSEIAAWYRYPKNAASLKSMIDDAYNADTGKIDNRREKMARNSLCREFHSSTNNEACLMSKLPLLVHLLFHPDSKDAQELAAYVHQQLNEDFVVPGLRVPTAFCPYLDGSRPPAECQLERAQRSFVVPLADNQLSIDDDWCRFVADTWQSCQGTSHSCMPIQLTNSAWPLDNRLKGVSFTRAHLQADESCRRAFVVRRIVIELCRYLLNLEAPHDETSAPVRLFLSHTKLDLAVEPRVTQQLIDYLKADQPVEAWVDSGDIPGGSEFAKEIKKGVEQTSLLVVLTDQYATREWCRKEVLLAKQHQRPVAVINALNNHEVRSFPYLGNVPVIRWDGSSQSAVDLVLKETLRNLHTSLVLNSARQNDDQIFLQPPELATLVGLPTGTTVLYADPPIGVEESHLLARTNVRITTPLQRLAAEQSLDGRLIALSMSESTDIERYGFHRAHFESAMVELSRYLLIKGAKLAFGGHLGASGYTEKLFELVRTHNDLEGVEPFERIVNYRGWPLPRLSVDELAELNQVSRTVELPRPADLDESLHQDFREHPDFFRGDTSALHRFAWARGMTDMRAYQADYSRSNVCARIVLGGTFGPTVKVAEDGSRQETWYSSRIPGVLEEILLSVQCGQPVFLIGAFGGVAQLVIDLLQGTDRHEATWDYQEQAPHAPEMRAIYEKLGPAWWDYPDMVQSLRDKGIAGINPLLTEEEHRELFKTIDPARMIELVLTGIGRQSK